MTALIPTMLLDGSKADETNIQAVYNGVASKSSGTITLKDGARWPFGFGVTPDPTKVVRWECEGSIDYGWGTQPGGYPMGAQNTWQNPVEGPADGDLFKAFNNGTEVWTRSRKSNPLNTPMLTLHYMNECTIPMPRNQEMLVLNGYVAPGAIGNVYPLQANIQSAGMGGYNICDVAVSTYCGQTGTNNGWAGVFLMADESGLGTDRPTKKWGTETDLQGSGPEQNGYWYNPYTGGRNTNLGAMAHYHGGASWQATCQYKVGAIIQNVVVLNAEGATLTWNSPVVDGSGNPTLQSEPLTEYYNAVCTTAGLSGATMPVFTLGAGAKPSLNADGSQLYINDGTAVWQLTVTMRAAAADCYLATTDPLSSYGRAFSTYAIIDDCVFSAWTARMNHPTGQGAAMRCAPNQPIDLNAGMENWAPRQNSRTLMYNAKTCATEISKWGTPILSVTDAGGVKSTGGLSAFGALPPVHQPVITGISPTDPIVAQMLAAGAAAGWWKDGTKPAIAAR